MKNLLTLLTALLIISNAFASDVTFLLTSNKYEVYLDGRKISDYQNRNNQIRLNNLPTGKHRLEVYKDKDRENDKYSRSQSNNNWSKKDLNKSKDKLVHSSYLEIRSENDYFIAIEKDGHVNIDERSRYKNRSNSDRQEQERRSRHRGSDNYSNGGDDKVGGYNNVKYERNTDYGNRRLGSNYHQAISNSEFEQLIQGIRNAWLGKFSKAKNGINNYYFYTDQVKQILQIFSSEKDRLELAKMSYSKTVKPSHFRDLYSLFSNSAQRELDDFVHTGRY